MVLLGRDRDRNLGLVLLGRDLHLLGRDLHLLLWLLLLLLAVLR
eukprot:COSAG06_NODE_1638_length_8838_cov_4.151619_4_plen_44_part_00